MHVAQGVVQWPECVEVFGCDRFDAAARLEHVHAVAGEAQVGLDILRLTIEELGRDAVEQDNGGCKRPVAVSSALGCEILS